MINAIETNHKVKNYKNQIRGAINRNTGEAFENLVNAACIFYFTKNIAFIEKTPEPVKVTKNLGFGKFEAHFEKKAQPDYKGTLVGGTSIVFEAKNTDSDRINQDRLTDVQFLGLQKYSELGAKCFVFVAVKLQEFYFVPWEVWQDMKLIYGRKYMTVQELKTYQVPFKMGVIQFLNNI